MNDTQKRINNAVKLYKDTTSQEPDTLILGRKEWEELRKDAGRETKIGDVTHVPCAKGTHIIVDRTKESRVEATRIAGGIQ
jgi:dihydrofolate reductase